jgi:hypothetical protein
LIEQQLFVPRELNWMQQGGFAGAACSDYRTAVGSLLRKSRSGPVSLVRCLGRTADAGKTSID